VPVRPNRPSRLSRNYTLNHTRFCITAAFSSAKRDRELGGRYLDSQLGWGAAVRGGMEVCQLGTDDHLEIFKSALDRGLVSQKLRSAFDQVAAPSFAVGPNSRSALSRASDKVANALRVAALRWQRETLAGVSFARFE
jgi:hypothetical protein